MYLVTVWCKQLHVSACIGHHQVVSTKGLGKETCYQASRSRSEHQHPPLTTTTPHKPRTTTPLPASFWFFLSLHNLLTMHGHRNLNLLGTFDVLKSASFGHRKSCRRHSILVTLTQFETNRMTRKGVQTGCGVGTALQKGKPMESEYSTFWL